MGKYVLVLTMTLFLTGCSTLSFYTSHGSLDKQQKIVVDSFANYTETPMAGYRASSIVDSALLQRGFKSGVLYSTSTDEYTSISVPLEERIEKAKKAGASFLVMGDVIEWRYKTGIDGEPAVSLVIRIYNTETSEIVYSSNGSKNGVGYSSIGVVANDVVDGMLP